MKSAVLEAHHRWATAVAVLAVHAVEEPRTMNFVFDP
jgi:hypothetical protein